MANLFLLLTFLSFPLNVVLAFQPQPRSSSQPQHTTTTSPSCLFMAKGKQPNAADDDEIDISDQDWRAFRARLVMQRRTTPAPPDSTRIVTKSDDMDLDGIGDFVDQPKLTPLSQKWAYDSGKVIEQGAIILGGVEQAWGFGLRQQYFHKAAILVLEHTATFTKGIILNRPTDMFLEEADTSGSNDDFKWRRVWFGGGDGKDTDDEQQFRVWFGGDVQGINSKDPDIVCLHSLQSEAAINASVEIMNDIQWTTFENAKRLVSTGVAKATDFWVFAGYAGWGKGQLMAELDRKSWYMVATDSQTLLKELARLTAGADPRDAGLETWNMLMNMIGKGKTAENYTGDFDDLMLKEWARERLLSIEAGGGGQALSYTPPDNNRKTSSGIGGLLKRAVSKGEEIAAGSMVRASSKTRSPFLLSYQELHKSLVLILSDDEQLSVGVILNRPSRQGLEIHMEDPDTGDQRTATVTLRFGGEIKLQGGDMIWLHFNPELREAGIGSEVGENKNNVWLCTEGDVTRAIGDGVAAPEDFMVFTGVTGWTKGDPQSLVDGMEGEVKNGNFEVVPFDKTDDVWSILAEQPVLDELNMVQNVAIANKAWKAAGRGRANGDAEADSVVFNSDVRVDELGDDALRSWVAAHLLGIGLKDYN